MEVCFGRPLAQTLALVGLILVPGSGPASGSGPPGGSGRAADPCPLGASGPGAETAPAVSVREAADATVRVERIAPDRWRVTYRLEEPTRALVFDRPAGFYRERAWSIVTPGYGFARRGDRQFVEAAPGRDPAAEIAVEFGEFREQLPREYELFVGFEDGGVALYTGHLYARPEGGSAEGGSGAGRERAGEVETGAGDPADGPGAAERPSIRTLEIVPPAETRAVLRGGVHDETFEWRDGVGDGTYIYFGTTEPVETDDMIAVLDGKLPEWLRGQFESWLPRLFAIYRERFGVTLPWKPLVLYGFEDADRPGLSWGGGTLTGLIQLTVAGTAWRERSAEGERSALEFLAHEAAHLWNGQLVQSADGGRAAWMHEGSADALAGHLLEELGLIDAEELRLRYEEAINNCLRLVGDASPNAAQDPRAPYECGQLMALWSVAAVRRAGSDADLFALWKALIERALRNPPAAGPARGEYDEAAYFATLADLGVDRTARARLAAFLAEAGGERREMAVAGLTAEGLEVEPAEDAPAAYGRELARLAMTHLMGQACDGRYSFDSGSTFRTYAIDGCAPFEGPLDVHRIAGFRVEGEGETLYDRVVATCAGGGSVSLEDAAGTDVADVPCDTALERRRPWLRLAALP